MRFCFISVALLVTMIAGCGNTAPTTTKAGGGGGNAAPQEKPAKVPGVAS